MGRDTGGVRGMNVSRGDNCVLAMDIARDDTELLVVTENGYGKRTPIADYPVKGRGAMGVKTIQLTEKKGGVAGALIVREHQDLVFISQNGMVQRTARRGHLAAGPPRAGRAGDEPARGRHGERRRAGDGERGGHLGGRRRATSTGVEPIDEVRDGRWRSPPQRTTPADGERTPTEGRTARVCFNDRTRERRWSELE